MNIGRPYHAFGHPIRPTLAKLIVLVILHHDVWRPSSSGTSFIPILSMLLNGRKVLGIQDVDSDVDFPPGHSQR
jgi:hypothetical protein